MGTGWGELKRTLKETEAVALRSVHAPEGRGGPPEDEPSPRAETWMSLERSALQFTGW